MSGIKNFLKRIFPPPTRSFMREMGELKRQKDDLWYWTHKWTSPLNGKLDRVLKRMNEQDERLDRMYDRMDRLYDLFASANRENLRLFFDAREERDAFRELLEKTQQDYAEQLDRTQQDYSGQLEQLQQDYARQFAAGEKEIAAVKESILQSAQKQDESYGKMAASLAVSKGELDRIYRTTFDSKRHAEEAVWAQVFNNTIGDSTWLKDFRFSPGRWAASYSYLYVLYRILDEAAPQSILELGLGQTTHMITQYVSAHPGVKHYVVESDPKWVEFYLNSHKLSENTEVVLLETEMRAYKEDENVRVFKGFKERFEGMKFDFISVDAPYGGDMKNYARIDILGILPACLTVDGFIILFDDCNRKGELNTSIETEELLKTHSIPYVKESYHGVRTTAFIGSHSLSYFGTL